MAIIFSQILSARQLQQADEAQVLDAKEGNIYYSVVGNSYPFSEL